MTERLYPLQDGETLLHLALREGHTACVEHLLSMPGIDVNVKDMVNWLYKCLYVYVSLGKAGAIDMFHNDPLFIRSIHLHVGGKCVVMNVTRNCLN